MVKKIPWDQRADRQRQLDRKKEQRQQGPYVPLLLSAAERAALTRAAVRITRLSIRDVWVVHMQSLEEVRAQLSESWVFSPQKAEEYRRGQQQR